MDARRVHAVMAAALSDPDLLDRWRQNPDVLRKARLDLQPANANTFLNALWQFAGLGEKIRHNDCRNDLPLTFRLLAVAGLEIEVFANLTRHAAALRMQGKKSSQDKITGLLAFLRDWHDPRDRRHALLWDLIRHETTVAELTHSSSIQWPVDSTERPREFSVHSVPYIQGLLRLNRMRFDPSRISEELRKQVPCLDAVDASPVCLGYWLDARCHMSLLYMDDLVFSMLNLVDGSRTVIGIAEYLQNHGAPVPAGIALRAFSALNDIGVVAF